MNFNASLAALTPREFAQHVIVDGLGLVNVVVGADFCFGKGRAGTTTDLVKFGQEMGFDVTIAPLIEDASIQISVNRHPKRIVRWAPTGCGGTAGSLAPH